MDKATYIASAQALLDEFRGAAVVPPDVLELTGFRTGESSEYKDQRWFIPHSSMKNRVEHVHIGGELFERTRDYQDSELWYGPLSYGEITLTLKDGTVYKGQTEPKPQEIHTENKVPAAWYRGLTNPNRPTWYFGKRMGAYPSRFRLNVPGLGEYDISNNGTRWESGGVILKQSDVPGRGMALVVPASHKPTGEMPWIEF